jgi:hypothetical protein
MPAQENARSLHNPQVRYYLPHEIVKQYALEIVQLLFYDGNPTGFVWSPEEDKTAIMVVDKHSFNLDQVNAIPAVVANRGPIQWMRSSGFRQMQSIDMRTDRRTYTDLVRGSATLSCFSTHGLEAESLAGYLFESFTAFRDVLRKIAGRGIMVPNHLGFFRIESTNMGEEALVKAESRAELSVVPIAILAHVQRRWSVEPTGGRKLKQVITRTSGSP